MRRASSIIIPVIRSQISLHKCNSNSNTLHKCNVSHYGILFIDYAIYKNDVLNERSTKNERVFKIHR